MTGSMSSSFQRSITTVRDCLIAAAIGRFDDDDIGLVRRGGIGLQGLVERTDVAGEDQANRTRRGIDLEFDEGAAENVTGIAQPRAHARQRFEPAVIAASLDQLKNVIRALQRISGVYSVERVATPTGP